MKFENIHLSVFEYLNNIDWLSGAFSDCAQNWDSEISQNFYAILTVEKQISQIKVLDEFNLFLIIIIASKRSLRRLCFYTCLSVILFAGGGVCNQRGLHL